MVYFFKVVQRRIDNIKPQGLVVDRIPVLTARLMVFKKVKSQGDKGLFQGFVKNFVEKTLGCGYVLGGFRHFPRATYSAIFAVPTLLTPMLVLL